MVLEFDRTKLRELRKQKNLRQQDLGEQVGKSGSHISNYENGVSLPPVNTLLSLMEFFNAKPREMAKEVKA
jgi:transcriptional regulator with XRE-family HTH domain